MRRLACVVAMASCLVGVASPAHAASGIVIGLWPESFAQFTQIQAASGLSIPYFRGRQRDGQFDTKLVPPDAAAAAAAGYSLGLNIQPKTGKGSKRTGILYTDISAQIQAGSGPDYDKLVSFAQEVLALPTYGVIPNYLQFHSEASTQAAPGVPAAQPFSGTGAQYQQCYALIHQLFDSLGVTDKIYWQVVLDASTYAGNNGGPQAWFPTDPSTYDLVGVDAYYRSRTWISPATGFGPALAFAQSQGKQIWIDETGADEGGPTNSVTAKAAWFASLAAYLEDNAGFVAGVVFSNASDGGNWYLDSQLSGGRTVPNYSGTTWTGWVTAVTGLESAAPPIRTLSVASAGDGTGTVTSSDDAISCGSICSAGYPQGAQVTLSALADPGFVFGGWSGAGVSCPGTGDCAITVGNDTTVTATFLTTRVLTVTTSGTAAGGVTSAPAGIDCGTTCSAGFATGSDVTLTPAPSDGSAFTGWSGACSGLGACTVAMDDDEAVGASFDLAPWQLTLTASGSGSGDVTSNPAGIDCGTTCAADFVDGASVTLTPSPSQGSAFTGWSGACSGTDPCTVAMDADQAVGADFELIPRTLTVSAAGAGSGDVTSAPVGIDCGTTCAADFPDGTVVVLSAAPAGGSSFAGWSGEGCAGTGSCSVTMDGAASVTATFAPPVTSSTLRDNDPAVAYDGWADVADGGASGGSYRMSNVKNDKVTWSSPSTTSLTWVTRTGPDQGKASVAIDGTNKGTVDLYAAVPATLDKVYSGLPNKAHTIVITVLHAKNGASSGFGVRLDAFVVGSATTQESAPAIRYDAWKSTSQALATDGTYRSTTSKTATVSVTFTGRSIDWITRRGKGNGKASVTLDGVAEGVVDLYQPASVWGSLITYAGLSAGTHTMVISVLGQKNAAASSTTVVVDGFIVHSS